MYHTMIVIQIKALQYKYFMTTTENRLNRNRKKILNLRQNSNNKTMSQNI